MYLLKGIKQFVVYLKVVKNSSHYTLRNYKSCLLEFNKLVDNKSISEITLDDVWQFRVYLKRKGLSVNWAEIHLVVLREFLKYLFLYDKKTLHFEKVEINKKEPEPFQYIHRDELQRIFDVNPAKDIISLRDKALLHFLYSTGCRISEVLKLNKEDIDFERKQLRVFGKGKKVRLVFLSDEACEVLLSYLVARKDKMYALFISHSRGGTGKNKSEKMRLSPTMAQNIVRTYAKKAKIIKPVTPHKLRHTFATELLRKGADLIAVRDLLGHKSVKTTQIYLHAEAPYLRDAFQKFHH